MFVFRCRRLPCIPLSLLVSLHVTPVKHSLASLIDKQLTRKATLMFQDVLLFKLSNEHYLILLLFLFKSTQKCSRQNFPVQEKAYCPLTAPGAQYVFSRTSQQPISVRHDLKTSSCSHKIHNNIYISRI